MYKLKIAEVKKTTSDCTLVELEVPEELLKEFSYKAGQYLTLEASINGEQVRRSYSLCSSPINNEFRVGIKKIPGGKFSTFANEDLKAGMELAVVPPKGHFTYKPSDTTSTYVFFAGGSGITPILSLIYTLLYTEKHVKIKLFYASRTVKSIILKEELEALKNSFMDRFEIFYFLTRQSRNMPLFDGRIDEDRLADLVKVGLIPVSKDVQYYACGPEGMIHDVKDLLNDKGVLDEQIHFELFNTSGPSKAQLEALKNKSGSDQAHLVIKEGEKIMEFDVTRGGDSILDAALNNGADLPYACKGGVCSTCKAKVTEGNVEMLLSYGLEQDQIDAGYVLTCQSWPLSDKVCVDFDV